MFPHASGFRKFAVFTIAGIMSAVLSVSAWGQPTPSNTLSSNEIVQRAAAEVQRYRDNFRDLLAKESKTFRIFDKNGSVKKQRTIISNFLVYDLSTTKNETTEFRNVLSVDGRPVDNSDDRAVELFEKVARASSTAKELERIQKESLRYDEEIKMFGLTLFQAIGLNEKVRNVMDFNLTGKTIIDGSETYVLKFNQTKTTPYISISGHPAVEAVLDYEYDHSGSSDSTINGTLWIDANTFQIVREERKLWVREKGMSEPALLTSNEFEFEKSGFGIRTPKRISHTEYRVEKERTGAKNIEIIYEYSAFTRPDVEVLTEKPKT